MKNQSAKAPALKDLLDKPLDLGYLELIEQTLRDAGINARWMFLLHKAFRSLKSYGSSPEHMMDLLSLLHESSDEKMQKMDLDDISVQHVTAGRSALGKVIELAQKKGKHWNCQGAPWLRFMPMKWPCESSVSMLQALDARASILMTRLGAAQEENDTCEEVAELIYVTGFCFLTVLTPPNKDPNEKDFDISTLCWRAKLLLCFFVSKDSCQKTIFEASLEITAPMAPQKQWLSEKMVETEGSFRTFLGSS